MKKAILALGLLAGLLMAGKAQATLTPYSANLVYDDVNARYWNLDASLSGFGYWQEQIDWANTLALDGLSGFHLATIDEMADLYNQLLALGGCSGSDCTGDQGPFTNIQSSYWSSEGGGMYALDYVFSVGAQGNGLKEFDRYGWAVRSVPEPATLLLMGIGLAGMALALRRTGKA